MIIRLLAALSLGFASGASAAPLTDLFAPATTEPARLAPGGTSVLPSGRLVTPAGQTTLVTHKPYGLALSPDGKTAVLLHNEVVTVVRLDDLAHPIRLPSYDKSRPAVIESGGFMGAVFSPDGRTVYLSQDKTGAVTLMDAERLVRIGEYKLDGPFGGVTYKDSLAGDMALSPDGTKLYVLDRANYRLVTLDRASGRVIGSVKVGRLPLALGLSPDGRTAYVGNVGLFEYPLVPGVTPEGGDAKMLHLAPYPIPSREAEEGVTLPDGRRLPGLGSPNAPEAMSVYAVDLATQTVTAKLKPGFQIGQMVEGLATVGGSSPSGVVVGPRFAYVSNATNDSIAVIDRRDDHIVDHVRLTFDPRLDRQRGLTPFHMALSPDGRRLYVTALALNAVAVIDTGRRRVLGYIPTGWGPTRVVVSKDGRTLYVTSARGYGAGPNGGAGFRKPPQGTYVGDVQLGLLQAIATPDDRQLADMTRRVKANTFREVAVSDDPKSPVPAAIGLRHSPVKYIVYVTKENRTFDDVFGGFPGVNGDPTIARLGRVDLRALNGSVLRQVMISPNHQEIARRWALSDNFFCDSDASVHGHRWMMGVVPNAWMESNTAVSKDWNAFSPAPGRRFPDSSGGIDPEDYNQIGGLWEQLDRHGIPFRSYGQSDEFAGVHEDAAHTDTGLRMPVIYPMSRAEWSRTSNDYAGFNLNIPDQLRMDQFEKEVSEKYLSGKEPFPRFISIQIPNDHMADTREDDGYPYRESFMADNDLALGRFLQFLSHTPYWKEMAVVILEDDPQGGVDHVDAHRSILMMAGPWIKKGYISHTHANFGAVLKTMYRILDLPPVNQFDAAANLLSDFFTDTPDVTPYDALPVDPRVFDPKVAMKKFGKDFDWRKVKGGEPMDDEDDQRQSQAAQHNPS
jgi:YVTN family beta-propeller protein